MTVHDVMLNCAGTSLGAGALVTDTSCQGQGLWLDFRVGPFPTTGPSTLTLALALDGVVTQTEVRPLPASLGFCDGCPGATYDTLGGGMQLNLAGIPLGVPVSALATVALTGANDPEIPFTILEPTPEPATLLLVGSVLALVGHRLRRR